MRTSSDKASKDYHVCFENGKIWTPRALLIASFTQARDTVRVEGIEEGRRGVRMRE
jgi:hypothetical protein